MLTDKITNAKITHKQKAKSMKGKIILGFFISLFVLNISAQKTYELVVNTNKVSASVNPDMYGIFFEDMNFAADGGLYAELVKNRSFDFKYQPLMGWTAYGNVKIMDENPAFDKNPNYARLNYNKELLGCGLINEGFRGIGLKKNEKYNFSAYVRTRSDTACLRIQLLSSDNDDVITSIDTTFICKDWSKLKLSLVSKKTEAKGKLKIIMVKPAILDIDHISLFPSRTWKSREGGLREDLVQALADLKPGVIRFPGGCIVEGNSFETRYQWKKTVGQVENRPLNVDIWNFKKTPDYFQSYGLGFFEYFQLCEDLGATALPVLNVGMTCQFAKSCEFVPLDKLDSYIQDALDLIEFANGKVDTKWGKLRAEMGHAKPFNLKYLAIGNEQWGPEYPKRLERFVTEIRKKDPSIKIIGSSGPSSDGSKFSYLWSQMSKLKVDLVDEHYYKSPDWFFQNAKRYDKYDRKASKVFAGEYASHDKQQDKANNFLSALSEAAFLTGIERNADIVQLATYAPLFAHKDAWQWKPDLIWFDNLRSVRSVNWYVQQMYSLNKGTNIVPITLNDSVVAGQDKLYSSAVVDKSVKTVIIKLVNADSTPKKVRVNLNGLIAKERLVQITTLSADLKSENTFEEPTKVIPVLKNEKITDNKIEILLSGNTFSVYKINM